MEHLRFGGRPAPGFGVGAGSFVKSSTEHVFTKPGGTLGAFLGGAAMSAIAGVAAVTFFGEGTNIGGIGAVASRLQRNWKVLAATAVAGGVVGAIAK
jgi:hypothetical protein